MSGVVKCGNPNLRDWMKEEMNKIHQVSSKLYFTYKKAYESLNKYPLPFSHPAEAEILEGIGPKIIGILTDRMKEYCKENGLPMPKPQKAAKSASKRKRPDVDDGNIQLDDNGNPIPFRPKPKRASRAYVPKYRSGGYGILLALLDIHDVGRTDATEQQICRLAQEHCDASYTLRDTNSRYTAWNSMKNLVEKGYVYKNGSPRKYQLTETGFSLAETLKQVNNNGGARGSAAGPSSTPRSRSNGTPISPGAAFAAAIGSDSDDDLNAIDMSQYVLNPEQYSTISINGRTSTNTFSNPSTARSQSNRSRFDDDNDIAGIDWDAVDLQEQKEQQEQQQQQQQSSRSSPPISSTSSSRADILAALSHDDMGTSSSDSRRKYSRKPTKAKGKSTASILENMLDSMGGEENLSRPDMSLYVMNPSAHQTILINGQTTTNNTPSPCRSSRLSTNTSSPSRPSTSATSYSRPAISTTSHSRSKSNNSSNRSTPRASSITNSNTSNFAKIVLSQDDDDLFDSVQTSTRYQTPATSSILKMDAANNKEAVNNKRQYNIDEYEMDMTETSALPALSSTQLSQPTRGDIVDLLSSPEPSPPLRPATVLDDELGFDDDFDPDTDYFPMSQTRNKHIADETFHFTYLDTDKKPQRHLAKAEVSIDDINGGLAYLVRYQTKQNSHPKAHHLIKKNVDSDFTTAYLPESHMETVAPGLPATPILPLHREEEDSFWPPVASASVPKPTLPEKPASVANTSNNNSQTFAFSSQTSQTEFVSQPFFPSQQRKKLDFDALVAKEVITETLRPDQYEIKLVLDSREIQMKGNRTYFQEKLADKGIQCITRSMDLGDVIWIARPIGSTDQAEELFLDYILERKRLDDLVSSIKDGRFIEQKTRLKRTGAQKVVYVVENYNREEAERFGLQAVQTAMSSTQIIDGIFLKRTNTIDETIDYLVSANNIIKRMYEGRTLHAIPGHLISRQTYLDLKQAYAKKAASAAKSESYLVSYPLFGQLNSKHGSTSVHEVYLRMLMTIRGVNAERALSLIKIYPTPRALLKAFRGKTVEEAKNLAKNATQNHISRRRWGVKISESLYQVWGSLEYPSRPESEDEDDEL